MRAEPVGETSSDHAPLGLPAGEHCFGLESPVLIPTDPETAKAVVWWFLSLGQDPALPQGGDPFNPFHSPLRWNGNGR